MLCWLDARSTGDRVALRLENLDPDRSKPEYQQAMIDDLAWFGLDWDAQSVQSDGADAHRAALDRLAAAGLLYPCSCTRAQIREAGIRTPDGGFRYDNRCRARELPSPARGGWRASREPLRARLPAGDVVPIDLGGLDLRQDPAAAFGDPIVLRRDGTVAYQLACVVDDAETGVTRIVRGRDLMTNAATQLALQQCLGFATPNYRHHLLLLERRGAKLAKLHGSVGLSDLRRVYSPGELCGLLAHAAGLIERAEAVTPAELVGEFSWQRVSRHDRIAHWTGERLDVSREVADS